MLSSVSRTHAVSTNNRNCKAKHLKMKSFDVVVIGSVLLTSVLTTIRGYPRFQTQIPNGDRVPNPCNRSIIWPGVGHQNSSGGGARNPFGLAFKANGLVWNEAFCKQDSDGDGLTNGYELGDPFCKWVVNATPFSDPTSHPGVCEPLDNPDCMNKNSWLMNCEPATFDCPAVNDSGVKNFIARLPPTPMPAQMTTYICYQFQLPSDSLSDIIAFVPVLDNAPYVHHMLLFACENQPQDHANNETFVCGMAPASCTSLIGAWAVGFPGQCLDRRMGFRIGPGGLRYGILQLHWNNPDAKAGLTDSSGLQIFYTSNLRLNSGQIMIIGQDFLEIPPGTPNAVFNGGCSSNCTMEFPSTIFVSTSFFHMHLIGKSGNITQYRNGTYVRTIQNVIAYDFNTPVTVNFPDLIEVFPGDDLRITCVYDSTSKTTPTYFGEQTSDEMCYGFLAYYTRIPKFNLCSKWKTIEICPHSFKYSNCDITTFVQLVSTVPTLCAGGCSSPACTVAMNGIYSTGCPSYNETIQFLAYFVYPRVLYSSDTTFYRCLQSTKPPGPGVASEGASTAIPFVNFIASGLCIRVGLLSILFSISILVF